MTEPVQLPAPPVQDERARTKLGRRAMIMAIVVCSFSIVMSVLIGLFGTTIYTYGTATSAGFRAVPNESAFGFQAFVGTVFGTWAVVQGIVAAAKNRGRSFGVVAIVVGASAPLVSLIVWLILGGAFGHHVSL
jgi:MFS family permease